MTSVVVRHSGGDAQRGGTGGRGARERRGLLDVESFAQEHRAEAEGIAVAALLDQVGGRAWRPGEAVEAEFGQLARPLPLIRVGLAGDDGLHRSEGIDVAETTRQIANYLESLGRVTPADIFGWPDWARQALAPKGQKSVRYMKSMMDQMVRVDRASLTLGFAGVYSTFLLHAKRLGAKYGLPARDILVELGKRKMIGGQEDMIEDTALTMARERGLLKQEAA